MPTLRGLGDEGECDASVRGRVRCPCRRRLHLQSRSTARVQPRRSRVPERVGKCLGGSAGGRRTARKSVISLQCEIPVRLMTASGHSRPMRSKPREHLCPLLPESGQVADRLGMWMARCARHCQTVRRPSRDSAEDQPPFRYEAELSGRRGRSASLKSLLCCGTHSGRGEERGTVIGTNRELPVGADPSDTR